MKWHLKNNIKEEGKKKHKPATIRPTTAPSNKEEA